MSPADPVKKSDPVWPSGPYSHLYYQQKEKLDAWHFGLDISSIGIMGPEKKIGVDAQFAGDLPLDGYQFVLNYRYYPQYFTINLPYQFGFGLGVKKPWGDFRTILFGQIPSLTETETFDSYWRAGASVQAVYNILETKLFRFALVGEAGLSVGTPESLANHMGIGLLMGIRR